jgi:hypothetical protein
MAPPGFSNTMSVDLGTSNKEKIINNTIKEYGICGCQRRDRSTCCLAWFMPCAVQYQIAEIHHGLQNSNCMGNGLIPGFFSAILGCSTCVSCYQTCALRPQACSTCRAGTELCFQACCCNACLITWNKEAATLKSETHNKY